MAIAVKTGTAGSELLESVIGRNASSSGVRWFILVFTHDPHGSLVVVSFVPLDELKPFPPEGLPTDAPSSPHQELSIQPGIAGQPTRESPRSKVQLAKLLARSRAPEGATLSSTREDSSSQTATSMPRGGHSGTGPIAPGSEGIAIGGDASSSAAPGEHPRQ